MPRKRETLLSDSKRMEETTSSSPSKRLFTRSQSQLAGRLTMIATSDSDKDSSMKETNRTSNRKPKPPPLRSQLAPITRSAFAAANFGQRNATTSPVLTSLPKPLPKTLEKETSEEITHPNCSALQQLPIKSQSKTRSGRTMPRPPPSSRRTQTPKPLGQRNIQVQTSNQQPLTNVKAQIENQSENNNTSAFRSTAAPQASNLPVRSGRGTNFSVHNLLAEAKAAKQRKAKNPLAQNIVERTRGKMLPLPTGDPTPPRKRQLRGRPGTAPHRNVIRKSPIRKPIARNAATVRITSEKKPQSTTRPQTKIQPVPNTISGKSRRPAGQKRRISQCAATSTRGSSSRQYTTRSRRRISYSSDEYGSESEQPGLQEEHPPSTRSKIPATHSNLHSRSKDSKESDSDAEASQPDAKKGFEKRISTSSSENSSESSESSEEQDSSYSTSESDTSDDGSKSDARPVRGGKSLSEHVLRQMGLSEKEIAERSTEQTQSLSKRNGTHKTVAQKSIAGKSIAANTITHKTVVPKAASKTAVNKTIAIKASAGKTLAGKTVAGKTVAGKTVAGKTVAGKTVAGKTAAGKTVAGTMPGKSLPGKSLAGKTLPHTTIPNRRTHAGGTRLHSAPSLPQPSRQAKGKLSVKSSNMIPEEENDSNTSSDSDSESSGYDSDNESSGYDSEVSSDVNDEKESERTKSDGCKSPGADFEARRKEIRDKCMEQLLERNRGQYFSSVREEFFLEMEYVLHLIGKLKNEEGARYQLDDSMFYFEKEIAPLRMDGLKSLDCQAEALSYSCWILLFHTRRRLLLQETSDPSWKENFAAVHEVLESAHKSARPGEKVMIQLDDSHLSFLLSHWKVLRNVSDVLALSSSDLRKLQREEGGCQLQ